MLDDLSGCKICAGKIPWLLSFLNVMMNAKKILPSIFAETSVEHILHRHSKGPKVIYLCVLALIVLGFVSLFFIKVDVSVRGQGLFKSSGERIYPKASGSGYVQYINPLLKENALITTGDTLLVIGRDAWDEQLQFVLRRIEEVRYLLADLTVLTNTPFGETEAINKVTPTFQTAMYQQSYLLFCRRYQNHWEQYLSVQKRFERDKMLYGNRVIALADYELTQHEYEKSLSGLAILYNEQMSLWRQEQQRYQDEQREIQSKWVQLTLQKQELIVIAPVTGTVQQLSGIRQGSFVTEGEVLMELSPEGALFAECWVTPQDIGLIRTGGQAVLRIDAFNYNEWGVLQAQVTDVAQDVVFVNEQPLFKVFCEVENSYMSLKNGYTAPLKRGMTFNIRFQVTQRTLFQWFYDRMDNWLNPNNHAQ